MAKKLWVKQKREIKGRKKGKINKTNKIIIFILSLLIILLSVFFIISLIDNSRILEKKTFYAEVTVSDHYGFDVNGTALIFGLVSPGGSSSRNLIVENYYDEDVRIKIYAKGKIKEFLQVAENDFVLKRGERKKVGFDVIIPKGTKYGKYEGEVIVRIEKER